MKAVRSSIVAYSLVLLTLTGCAQAVDRTIAGAIKKALPSAIGPAQSYLVSVSSDPLEAAKGHLKSVDIVGTDVNLSPDLLVDQLDVHASDIDADPMSRKVKSIGQVRFTANLSQSSIDRYVDSQPEDSQQKKEHLRIELNDSSITASIQVRTLGVTIPVSVTGTFEVENGNPKYIDFVPDSGSLSIIPIPEFALRFALKQINPVINLTDTTVPVTVDTLGVQSQVLIFSGEADLQQGLVQGT